MQMRKTLALCRFWEKHFLRRSMGLGFHCGHIEACLWLILLPCLLRLHGCCFLVFFIFVFKRVDAVKPGGNLRFSPRLSGRWAFPPWAGARTPASADWAGATCPTRALLFISRGVVLPLLRSAEHRFPLQIDAWACHHFPLFVNFYFLFNQATPVWVESTHCSYERTIRQAGGLMSLVHKTVGYLSPSAAVMMGVFQVRPRRLSYLPFVR